MSNIFDLFKKIEKSSGSSAPITHIIAGLGNIGAEYDKTRHNAGFIAIDALAEKYGVTPVAIAFAWILRHPAFKQVVTGTTTPERMEEICKAADIRLTHEEWYSLYFAAGNTLP